MRSLLNAHRWLRDVSDGTAMNAPFNQKAKRKIDDFYQKSTGCTCVTLSKKKEKLQARLRMLKAQQQAHELAAKTAQARGDALYWPIYNLDQKNPHAKAGLEHADPKDLIAAIRGHEAEVMRLLDLAWPVEQIYQTVSDKSSAPRISQTLSAISADSQNSESLLRNSIDLPLLAKGFPLPWSAYVRLLSVKNKLARSFYETEALRCGWSVRQLDRQIGSQFYERTALSRNKAAMLQKGEVTEPGDVLTAEQAIKDPFVLEFLNLKDEYSESDLEEGLIQHLADFLLELGDDFAFVGRQRRLRLDDTWFRIDLLFFHRQLKCLVVIDLKVGKFSYADAGQMHLYLNYAREHWMKPGENPPVGLILCAKKGAAEAHYALEGLSNTVLAAEYRMVLPDEKLLADELDRTRRELEARRMSSVGDAEGGE